MANMLLQNMQDKATALDKAHALESDKTAALNKADAILNKMETEKRSAMTADKLLNSSSESSVDRCRKPCVTG